MVEHTAALKAGLSAQSHEGKWKERLESANRRLQSLFAEAEGSLTLPCDALLQRAVALDGTAEFGAAMKNVNDILQCIPNHILAFQLRAHILLDQGRREQAIGDYSQLLQLDPKNVHARWSRGLTFSEHGSFVDALADFNSAIAVDPHQYQSLMFEFAVF